MLTNETREVLKSLIPINNTMIVSSEMTGTDEFKSILFKADLGQLEEIEEFGIYDVTSFLSALDLLEEPEIVLDGNLITAKDSNSSLQFVTSDVSSLEDVHIKPSNINTTLDIESILEFTFNSDALNKIKKSANVFKTFDTVYVVKEGSTVQMKLGAMESYNKSNNSFTLNVDATLETSKDFHIAVPLETLMKVPAMDYNFMVKYNEERDTYRVVLENQLLTFLMSLKK